jgi:hypothetical protein
MPRRAAHGLTLVEMLVAMTASLILFGAVVTIFQILGEAVSRSRHAGRLDSELCSIRTRLQQDLAGVTANKDANGLLCEVNSGSVSGYFEVIEGPNSDLVDFSTGTPFNRATNAPGPTQQSNDGIVGDTDDLLFFTTRNVMLDPFIGKFGSTTASAEQAEVAWFCRPTPGTSNPTLYTVYRRQLLIVAGFRPPFASDGSMPWTSWPVFYSLYDVSARREDRGTDGVKFVLNTANDLQRRRNRFGHDAGNLADISPIPSPASAASLAFTGARENEDVIATNALAFDVRLEDPRGQERQIIGQTVRMQPSDEKYWLTNNNLVTTTPVYGDLGFNAFSTAQSGAAPGDFGGFGRAGHRLTGSGTSARVYDTWTSFYATNNQDDDGINGTDDDAERAPYPDQLPGIKIVIRLYDPDTKSVKQATIMQSLRK